MSAKRLAVLVVPVLVLVSSALAQVNEVSITAGRTFVSTQTVPTAGLPVHFGAGLEVWVWHTWGGRFEARDFYSGTPALNVTGEAVSTITTSGSA